MTGELDKLDDMLVRVITRKAPGVTRDEAVGITAYFRTLLNNDRRIIVNIIRVKLDMHGHAEAAALVKRIMESYND